MTVVEPRGRRLPEGFEPIDGEGNFVAHIGPLAARDDVVGVRLDDRHTNVAGKAQGGMLATLVDFAIGRAVRHASPEAAARTATVSLTCDFLGPAAVGDWVAAHTTVERIGGTLAFVDCSLMVEGREVVRGRAVFAVLG